MRSKEQDKAPLERDARYAARRKQYIEVATKLMEQIGYHEMTTERLARDAGTSAGLLYKYFGSKEEVLLAVITNVLECYSQEVPKAIAAGSDTLESLVFGFSAYCFIVDENRKAAILAYRESKTLGHADRRIIMDMEQHTTALLADVVRRGAEEGIFTDVDPMLFAYDLVMLAHMWALKHWNIGRMMIVEDYILFQLKLLLGSILRSSERENYLRRLSLKSITQYRKLRENRGSQVEAQDDR